MPTFFTPVKKYCEKDTHSISRLLGATSKNTETRAICGVDIRDMEFQKPIKTN
jgi:hypothetical protein